MNVETIAYSTLQYLVGANITPFPFKDTTFHCPSPDPTSLCSEDLLLNCDIRVLKKRKRVLHYTKLRTSYFQRT